VIILLEVVRACQEKRLRPFPELTSPALVRCTLVNVKTRDQCRGRYVVLDEKREMMQDWYLLKKAGKTFQEDVCLRNIEKIPKLIEKGQPTQRIR